MSLHMQYSRTMNDMQKSLSRAILVRLARQGRKQSWLAKRVNKSPMWVSSRITGRVLFDTDDIALIASAFDTDPFALLREAQNESSKAA